MTNDTAPWRPELVAGLRLLARISEALHRRGLPRPILVGGAAVEYYSASALMTGDIDLASPVQPEVEEELLAHGFSRPAGPGHTPFGWLHPELKLGIEIVASTPLGGAVDSDRIQLVRPIGETAVFRILPVEDMIADRMGQYASGAAPDMGGQAAVLFALYPDLDRAYLERRIRDESCGDYGLDDIPAA
jgi:hypothetical protein